MSEHRAQVRVHAKHVRLAVDGVLRRRRFLNSQRRITRISASLFVIGAVRAFALSGPATNSVWSSVVVPVLLLAMVGCLIQSHRSTIALENIEQNLFTLLFLRDALEPGAGSNAFLIEPAVDGANIDDWILGWSSEAVGWRLHFKTNGLVPIVREGRRHG